jgi:hypothetical protein
MKTKKQQIRTRLNHVVRENAEVFNLTKHDATREQRLLGLTDAGSRFREEIKQLLDFDQLPSSEDLIARATKLADFALLSGCSRAMIGGPSFFVPVIEAHLIMVGIEPVYAFLNESSEKKLRTFGGFVNSMIYERSFKCQTF